MAPKLSIVFDNGVETCVPGQSLSGHVQVTVKKRVSCKALHFKVEGFAYVYLKSRKQDFSSSSSPKVDDSSAKEEYYTIDNRIWGDGSSPQVLSAGVHQFNFSFTLPSNIPSSFEAKYGHVRHRCTATLELQSITNLFRNPSCSSLITLINDLDLDSQEFASKTIKETAKKKMGSWFNKMDHISISVNISHSGYVPGDNIIINAECINQSGRVIKHINAEVHQTTYFKVGDRSTVSNHTVCTMTHTFPEGKLDTWSRELLEVPTSFVPPNLHLCNIIDVTYTFRFKVIPESGRLNLELTAPLVLGTKRAQSSSDKIDNEECKKEKELSHHSYFEATLDVTERQQGFEPSAPFAFDDDFFEPDASLPNSMYPNLPPPTYNDVINELKNVRI